LQSELLAINEKISQANSKVDELHTLQDKQDGLLENLFNGDYGSELEDKLEEEYETLRINRDRCILAVMNWRGTKDALSKACSQLAYCSARWNQIQEYPNLPNPVRDKIKTLFSIMLLLIIFNFAMIV